MATRRMIQLVVASTLLLVTIPARASLTSANKATDNFDSAVASTWFDQLYDVVKTEKTSPPVAARIYGVAAVALYESVVPGTLSNRSLAGQLNGGLSVPQPDPPHRKLYWPAVANAALATAIRGLFPTLSAPSLAAIDALEQQFATALQSDTPRPVYERSAAQGQAVANAVLEWAASDGYADFNDCPFTPPVGPGLWVPTPPAFSPRPLQPCWGQLRPFVLTSAAECAPPAPPVYSTQPSSELFGLAMEVYNTNLNLTPDQHDIALFWADNAGASGTPPGHWIALMAEIARNDDLSLAAAAEGFARVGIAVADAFISCWNAKYSFNFERPVTYIQNTIAPAWLPLLATPSFPSYTSGHSTQSQAAATVLTDMFGARAFTDNTLSTHALQPALAPRAFDSFDGAADEAARSRLYAGIHFSTDNDVGLEQGRCIGEAIVQRVQFSNQ